MTIQLSSNVFLHQGDAMDAYASWPSPTVIISDGPYGVSGYPGDAPTPDGLVSMYESHVEQWSAAATGATTLWFWCTEIGWATVHPLLAKNGWQYKGCNIWNKGVGHIAGNCNGKTMKKFPPVTEVCVQYTFNPTIDGLQIREWLRHEWKRTGMPFNKTNEACGVLSAATRKYMTLDHLFYSPPPPVFTKLALYANEHGDEASKPYFGVTDEEMENPDLIEKRWAATQAKFNFEYGVTNVWDLPGVRGHERLKNGTKVVHSNQKPIELIRRLVKSSSDENDVVWDLFCGSGTTSIVCQKENRVCYTAEMSDLYVEAFTQRLEREIDDIDFNAFITGKVS